MIDQGPAGVARVDSRIGLNEILECVDTYSISPGGTDDSLSYCLADAERIPGIDIEIGDPT